MECLAELSVGGHEDGGAAGRALHAPEGEAGPAAHTVRPCPLRQAKLQGRPQSNVSGRLPGQTLGVQLLLQQVGLHAQCCLAAR